MCLRLYKSDVSQLVADTLMVLYKSGWTPLTPINVAAVGASPRPRVRRPRPGPATHLAVCFIRTEADTSRDPPAGEGAAAESCLCIETYRGVSSS